MPQKAKVRRVAHLAKIKISFPVALLALALFGFAFGLWLSFLPVSSSSQKVFFEVKKGESLATIANNLRAKNLARSRLAVRALGRLQGKKARAGLYYLSPSQTLSEIYQTLVEGKFAEKRVTFIEGWRIEQYAQILDEEGIVGIKDFVTQAKNEQGKLFPDTYRLPARADAKKIIKIMEDNYKKRMAQNSLEPTQEQLIIASIVEREAKNDDERAKVAGVFYNRLRRGMRLEADPSVQYARDNLVPESKIAKYKYWQPLKGKDFLLESPFNTYQHLGVPPSPIANPGLASIKAAVHPSRHDYYYFFHNKEGKIFFSKTQTEHLRQRRREGV